MEKPIYFPSEIEETPQGRNWEKIIQVLHRNRDLVNKPVGQFGETLLHEFVYGAPKEFIEKLILLGADLEATTNFDYGGGETPIFNAVRRCDIDIIQLLFHYGAKSLVGNSQSLSLIGVIEQRFGDVPSELRLILTKQFRKEESIESMQLQKEAERLINENNNLEAEQKLEEALNINKRNGQAANMLGKLLLERDQRRARELFIQAYENGESCALISAWGTLPSDEYFCYYEYTDRPDLINAIQLILQNSKVAKMQ